MFHFFVKMNHRLSIWFIVVLVFAGNIGISVYSHICSKDGVFISLLISNDSHCQEKQKNLPPCCQKKKSKKDNCCHNETKVIKLKADYSASFSKLNVELREIAMNELK